MLQLTPPRTKEAVYLTWLLPWSNWLIRFKTWPRFRNRIRTQIMGRHLSLTMLRTTIKLRIRSKWRNSRGNITKGLRKSAIRNTMLSSLNVNFHIIWSGITSGILMIKPPVLLQKALSNTTKLFFFLMLVSLVTLRNRCIRNLELVMLKLRPIPNMMVWRLKKYITICVLSWTIKLRFRLQKLL